MGDGFKVKPGSMKEEWTMESTQPLFAQFGPMAYGRFGAVQCMRMRIKLKMRNEK
jgi:hypothetical protein